MTDAYLSSLDQLWQKKERAQAAWYQANVDLVNVRADIAFGDGATTPGAADNALGSVFDAQTVLDGAITALRLYYATCWGDYGTAVLDAYLTAETEVDNACSDLHVVYLAATLEGPAYRMSTNEAVLAAKKVGLTAARLALVALNGPHGQLIGALVLAQYNLKWLNHERLTDYGYASDEKLAAEAPDLCRRIIAATAQVAEAEQAVAAYVG